MKIVTNFNPFMASISLLYPLKQEKSFALLVFSGGYKMGTSARNGLKGLDRFKHVDLPHKLKSYDIIWELFYHIASMVILS